MLMGFLGRNAIPKLLTNAWESNDFQTPFDWPVFVFTAAAFAFELVALVAPAALLAPALFVLFTALFGADLATGDFAPEFALDFESFFMGNCLCFFLLCAPWRGLGGVCLRGFFARRLFSLCAQIRIEEGY